MQLGPTAIALSCFYLALALVVCFQLARIIAFKHSIMRFQFAFLILCFVWTVLRCMFWLNYNLDTWPVWGVQIIYWLPMGIQFATFALLVLFFCSVLYKANNSWEEVVCCLGFLSQGNEVLSHERRDCKNCQRKNIFVTVYLVLTVVFCCTFIIYIVLDTEFPGLTFSLPLVSVVCGILFLLLMAILAVFAFKCSRLHADHSDLLPTQKSMFLRGQVTPRMIYFSYVIAVIFTTRSIYDFVSAFSDEVENWGAISFDPNFSITLFGFFMFLVWEIIPTALILIQFRKIPKAPTERGSLNAPATTSITMSAPPKRSQQGKEVQPRNLFQNRNRYDSDDESQAGTSVKNSYASSALPPPHPQASYGSTRSGGPLAGAASADIWTNYSFSPSHQRVLPSRSLGAP